MSKGRQVTDYHWLEEDEEGGDPYTAGFVVAVIKREELYNEELHNTANNSDWNWLMWPHTAKTACKRAKLLGILNELGVLITQWLRLAIL